MWSRLYQFPLFGTDNQEVDIYKGWYATTKVAKLVIDDTVRIMHAAVSQTEPTW